MFHFIFAEMIKILMDFINQTSRIPLQLKMTNMWGQEKPPPPLPQFFNGFIYIFIMQGLSQVSGLSRDQQIAQLLGKLFYILQSTLYLPGLSIFNHFISLVSSLSSRFITTLLFYIPSHAFYFPGLSRFNHFISLVKFLSTRFIKT